MAQDTYTLKVIAATEEYVAGLKKVGKYTDEQVSKAALAYQKQLYKMHNAATKAAERAAKGADSAWSGFGDTADEVGAKAAKLRGALDSVSPAAGAVAGLVNDLGDAASLIVSPVGAAVAAVTALALGGAALGAALVQAAFSASEALNSLEGFKRIGSDFYPQLPPETIDRLEQLAATGDALNSVWDRLVVVVGSSVTPTVEHLANVVVGAALSAGDLYESMSRGIDILEVFGRAAVAYVVQPFAMATDALDAYLAGLITTANALGVELPAGVRSAAATVSDLSRRLDLAATGLVDQAVAGTGLGTVLADLDTKGSTFIHTQRRATAAMKDHKKETYDLTAGLSALLDVQGKANEKALTGFAALRAARDGELAQLDELFFKETAQATARGEGWDTLSRLYAQYEAAKVAVTEESEAKIQELRRTTLAQELAGLEEGEARAAQKMMAVQQAQADLIASMEAAQKKAMDGGIGIANDFAGALGDAFGSAATLMGEQNSRAASQAFTISQGLGVAQAMIAAYKAGAETMAAVAAIPGAQALAVPAGIAMGAAVMAASVAKIAAMEPPSFAMGGVLSGGGRGGVDHQLVSITRQEREVGFLNGRGTAMAGGPRGVAALNRGESGGAQVIVVQAYGGRLEQLASRAQERRTAARVGNATNNTWRI